MLKMNRKYLIIIAVLIIIISLAGCGRISNKQNIYSNNKQIIKESDTYTYLSKVGSGDSVGKDNQFDFKFKGFSGMDTLYIIKAGGNCEVQFSYNCEIYKGEFKAVLITPKKEVLNIVEGSNEDIKTIELDEGEYRLKIVGKDAKGKIQISVEDNPNISLTINND